MSIVIENKRYAPKAGFLSLKYCNLSKKVEPFGIYGDPVFQLNGSGDYEIIPECPSKKVLKFEGEFFGENSRSESG